MKARAALTLALAFCSPLTWSAGGHHAVDDATIIDAGRCEAEAWFARVRAEGNVLHAGSGCRVGPVELSVAVDRAGAEHSASFQVKAAWPVGDNFSVGALAAPFRRGGTVREEGMGVVLLATWTHGPWSAHANLGREFASGGNTAKSGAGLEWASGAWSWALERYTEGAGHFVRAGLRWQLKAAWSLDVSHARHLHGAGASSWTLGSTWGFAAP